MSKLTPEQRQWRQEITDIKRIEHPDWYSPEARIKRKQRIAELYLSGAKLEVICADVSVTRAAIYKTLDQMGIPRNRQVKD